MSWAATLRAAGFKPEDFLQRGNGERLPSRGALRGRPPKPKKPDLRPDTFTDTDRVKIASHLFAMQRERLLRVWVERDNVFVGPYDHVGYGSCRVGITWAQARKIADREGEYLQYLLKPLRSR